ncbi:hypothetical protein N665_0043s0042 [Sinapis alba]|nr:hypothetical protein N665_0043s0042 [Sinapis alba]
MRGRGPRGGFPSSCGGDGSTSTLNQHQNIDVIRPSVTPENTPFGGGSPRTLDDMILARARLRESYYGSFDNCNDDDHDNLYRPVRMSSARNALNQYPRFSLDGKDAMYRSSFRCQFGAGADMARQCRRRSSQMSLEAKRLPQTVAGENVVWCAVVAKLMGLEMIPVTVKGGWPTLRLP